MLCNIYVLKMIVIEFIPVYSHGQLVVGSNIECREHIYNTRLFIVFWLENCLGNTLFTRITAMKGINRELLIVFKLTPC